ncbi:MAG TPA: dodecin family protein [Candidatus Bathyarchaeia archaeon]|nr:dodecin family protein [Candidatus Bathyarchaeia archaeon]
MVEKTVELTGTSANSIEDAAALAISRAAVTISGIRRASITDTDILIEDGRIVGWRVSLRVSFEIKDKIHE